MVPTYKIISNGGCLVLHEKKKKRCDCDVLTVPRRSNSAGVVLRRISIKVLKRVSINRAIFSDIVPYDFHYNRSQDEPLDENRREHPQFVPSVRVGA